MAENHINFTASQSSVFPFTRKPPQNGADVDGVLFNNLGDIVPLDESHKASDLEGRKSVSATKQKDLRVNTNEDSKFACEEAEHIQNNGFELTSLNEEISNLERQMLGEEEALQSAEESLNQMSARYDLLRKMRRKVAENDELLKAAISEYYNLKTMLAEKRATDNISMDLEMEMIGLAKTISAVYLKFHPRIEDKSNIQQVKEARAQYLAAIASMKSNPGAESVDVAFQARKRFYALLK